LAEITQHITEQLRFVQAAPSVQFQTIPPDLGAIRDEVEERLKEENEERRDEVRRAREAAVGTAMEL
jgi:histone deacetylase HOS2